MPVAIVALLALALHVALGVTAALLPWALVGLLLWLFRDPPFSGSSHPLALVSPVRGTVHSAGPATDPYEGGAGHMVQVDADWRGPYLVRCPIEGALVAQWGEWREPGSPTRRRGGALRIRTDEGDEVTLALSGRVTVSLTGNLGIGDRVGHAKVIGLMPFGGRAAVYFSGHGRVLASAGLPVSAGVETLAELLHD